MVINGNTGDIGVSVDKRQKLAQMTRELLRNGYCSGKDMSRLVGRYTWSMLIRRPSLSIFSATYRFIQAAGNKRYGIWPSVRRELTAAMNILPLLSTSIRSPWRQRLTCVDASEKGMGVVYNDDGLGDLTKWPAQTVNVGRNDVTETVSLMSSDANDQKQHHLTSLSSKSLADNDNDQTRPLQPLLQKNNGQIPANDISHSLKSLVVNIQSRSWRDVISSSWRYPAHINALETITLLTAVRWTMSFRDSINHRLLMISDSSTVVGAMNKGRSSAHRILRPLRSIACLLLAARCALRVMWVPSEFNPADEPSRRMATSDADDGGYSA